MLHLPIHHILLYVLLYVSHRSARSKYRKCWLLRDWPPVRATNGAHSTLDLQLNENADLHIVVQTQVLGIFIGLTVKVPHILLTIVSYFKRRHLVNKYAKSLMTRIFRRRLHLSCSQRSTCWWPSTDGSSDDRIRVWCIYSAGIGMVKKKLYE